MFTALLSSRRIRPEPGIRAECPFCHTPVTAKCGRIKAWHFAHLTGTCESWAEPDTEWTNYWKSLFPLEAIEPIHNGQMADLRTDRFFIKLSHTALTRDQIAKIETTLSPMVWLIDATSAKIRIQSDPEGFVRFTWLRPKTAWLGAQARLFFDIGDSLLAVRKHRTNAKGQIRGWGYVLSHAHMRGI